MTKLLPIIEQTCAAYKRMTELGGDPSEIVTGLAALYNVQRPAIWRRLRTGGVLPPYNPRTRGGQTYARKLRQSKEYAIVRQQTKERLDAMPRVFRDPCPRCGTRGDIRCGHAPVRLGTAFL